MRANFAEKLYQSLAIGLSLDEALTFARLCVVEPERSFYDCDGGRFMVYMPTESAVLFPRSERSAIRRRQQTVRSQRAETIEGLVKRLDGEGVGRMLSDSFRVKRIENCFPYEIYRWPMAAATWRCG